MNPYSGKKLSLPEPGFYVIYSGTRKEHPEWISLADEFLGGDRFSLELRVKVLYESNKGDILDQYLKFTSIYNGQIKRKSSLIRPLMSYGGKRSVSAVMRMC